MPKLQEKNGQMVVTIPSDMVKLLKLVKGEDLVFTVDQYQQMLIRRLK